jgi:hypothetical protein
LQHEGKGVPEASLPFHRAMPSITHMALVALEKAGILKFVISQVFFFTVFVTHNFSTFETILA